MGKTEKGAGPDVIVMLRRLPNTRQTFGFLKFKGEIRAAIESKSLETHLQNGARKCSDKITVPAVYFILAVAHTSLSLGQRVQSLKSSR